MLETQVSFWLAFLAGLLSFFTPCVLPLIPIYIAYLAGLADKGRNKLLTNALGFVIGFTVIFILLGASATMLGRFLLSNQVILQKIAGVIIFIFGMQLAQIINIPFLNLDKRMHVASSDKTVGFWQSFLFGLAFSSGWTPCIGPILGSILTVASTTKSLANGVLLLLVYAIGLGIPFIVTALFIDHLKDRWSVIVKKTVWLGKLAGYLLIIFGVMMFFGWLQALSGLLPAWGL